MRGATRLAHLPYPPPPPNPCRYANYSKSGLDPTFITPRDYFLAPDRR